MWAEDAIDSPIVRELASIPQSDTCKVSTCIGCARTGVILRSRQSNCRQLHDRQMASTGTNDPVFRSDGHEREEANVEQCTQGCMVMTIVCIQLSTFSMMDPYNLQLEQPAQMSGKIWSIQDGTERCHSKWLRGQSSGSPPKWIRGFHHKPGRLCQRM